MAKFTYLNFLSLNQAFIIDHYHCYGGFFNIPATSSFYDDVLTKNNIPISKEKVEGFFSSKKGKVAVTKEFTTIYIKPVKKVLKKHKLLNLSRLKLLVGVKIVSKSKYLNIAKSLISSTTDSDIIDSLTR